MIAAEASMYESFIIAGAELSKSGVEYISGLGMFVGTGGLSAPASAVVATQATLDLTAAGTCAVAGVAFGGIAGNAKFAYDRDSAQGSGKPSFKTPSNQQANQIAKQNGYVDAHDLKEAFVGKSNISKFDMKIDKATGEIFLEGKQNKALIPTGLFE